MKKQFFGGEDCDEIERSDQDDQVLRQIRVDIPRTNPGAPLFAHEKIKSMMERILYIWSLKHPASSYVQGINDLLTPFLIVLVASELNDTDYEKLKVDSLDDEILTMVEENL